MKKTDNSSKTRYKILLVIGVILIFVLIILNEITVDFICPPPPASGSCMRVTAFVYLPPLSGLGMLVIGSGLIISSVVLLFRRRKHNIEISQMVLGIITVLFTTWPLIFLYHRPELITQTQTFYGMSLFVIGLLLITINIINNKKSKKPLNTLGILILIIQIPLIYFNGVSIKDIFFYPILLWILYSSIFFYNVTQSKKKSK